MNSNVSSHSVQSSPGPVAEGDATRGGEERVGGGKGGATTRVTAVREPTWEDASSKNTVVGRAAVLSQRPIRVPVCVASRSPHLACGPVLALWHPHGLP